MSIELFICIALLFCAAWWAISKRRARIKKLNKGETFIPKVPIPMDPNDDSMNMLTRDGEIIRRHGKTIYVKKDPDE